MFKNFLIGILAVSVALFAWLAIRNSKPLECTEVVYTPNGNYVCLVNVGHVSENDVTAAVKQIQDQGWKY